MQLVRIQATDPKTTDALVETLAGEGIQARPWGPADSNARAAAVIARSSRLAGLSDHQISIWTAVVYGRSTEEIAGHTGLSLSAIPVEISDIARMVNETAAKPITVNATTDDDDLGDRAALVFFAIGAHLN